jgi:DNA-directed RNA polymerase specialized sigma24 family protein
MHERSENLELLGTLYDRLENDSLKEALYLTVIKDMTVKEAAAIVGVPVTTMTRRKERGRLLLKERYEDACNRGSAPASRSSQVHELHSRCP